jgi:hypothetical protein
VPLVKIDFSQIFRDTEFDLQKGDFADLEIRSDSDERFCYFYSRSNRRLIKDFLLREGPRVDTLCGVILIPKEQRFTPRLTFWKRDKTKAVSSVTAEEHPVTETATPVIKARVDLGDCHENLWKLIDFLQACKDIDLPDHDFRIVEDEQLVLARAFEGHHKDALLYALKAYLAENVTERDIQMLLDRRKTLEYFRKLLQDPVFFASERDRLAVGPEGVWQRFFEENTWIFGYGLTLLACERYSLDRLEQITTGSNVFTGGGKRNDALMKTKGIIQSLLFAEIKTHQALLLSPTQYRKPDVYQISTELSGAVSQVQKTAHKAIRDLRELHRSHDPE